MTRERIVVDTDVFISGLLSSEHRTRPVSSNGPSSTVSSLGPRIPSAS